MLDVNKGMGRCHDKIGQIAVDSIGMLEGEFGNEFRHIHMIPVDNIGEVVTGHRNYFTFTLFDSAGKKTDLIREAVAALVAKQRYEEEGKPVDGELYYLHVADLSEAA